MSQRISFRVRGEVQGVFYRAFTQERARGLGVTGHVRNEADGTVAGEAQGERSALDALLKDMRKGPRHARVANVDSEDVPTKTGEKSFETR